MSRRASIRAARHSASRRPHPPVLTKCLRVLCAPEARRSARPPRQARATRRGRARPRPGARPWAPRTLRTPESTPLGVRRGGITTPPGSHCRAARARNRSPRAARAAPLRPASHPARSSRAPSPTIRATGHSGYGAAPGPPGREGRAPGVAHKRPRTRRVGWSRRPAGEPTQQRDPRRLGFLGMELRAQHVLCAHDRGKRRPVLSLGQGALVLHAIGAVAMDVVEERLVALERRRERRVSLAARGEPHPRPAYMGHRERSEEHTSELQSLAYL